MSRSDSSKSGIGRALGVTVLALASGAAQPAACLYRGTDDSARVIGRTHEIIVPFPTTQSSADCEQLRVAVGTVSVYVLSAERSAITARAVSVGGGPLVRMAPGAESSAPGARESGLLAEIQGVLAGGQRSTTGSSRGAEADYLLGALPVGKLARPEGDLVIPLGPVPDANLAAFELVVDGRSAYRQLGPARELKLPAAVLVPGAKVVWRLTYSGQRHEGRLAVVPPDQLAALRESLGRESAAETDAGVTRLRVASGLLAEGYAWDARALIRDIVMP